MIPEPVVVHQTVSRHVVPGSINGPAFLKKLEVPWGKEAGPSHVYDPSWNRQEILGKEPKEKRWTAFVRVVEVEPFPLKALGDLGIPDSMRCTK